ncbi:glucose-1-phosphate adenylyltransferase [bacterium]|nr:glucose-1-phosphate adenylyltransferase [bacterium]
MSNALVMILAGGQGKRLSPLTMDRAKPAVPFGGSYRIIDFVLSNFVNSGFMQIKVLTQFKADSLIQHIARNWTLSPTINQYVDSVPAQMRTGSNWYLGSADAIYQNLNLVRDDSPQHVFVFSGDHIYKMDVSQMYSYHVLKKSDMTIAAMPVPIEEASAFGVIEIDSDYRMIGFEEKPKNPKPIPGKPDMALVSMGNYLFSTETLVNAVVSDAKDPASEHDFGKNVIPAIYPHKRVYVYDFLRNLISLPNGNEYETPYWRDVGTLKSYFDAHMDLVSETPKFNLYNRNWPIFGFPKIYMPPAKFVYADSDRKRMGIATNSLISEGCLISGGHVSNSVCSPGVRVYSYAEVDHCVIMNDVEIGRYCRLQNVIVDKNVVIPPDTQIGFDLEKDRSRGLFVTDEGIVVVPKGFDFQAGN